MSFLTHLECSVCAKRHEAGVIHNLCDCGGPLLVRYDLDRARRNGPGIACGWIGRYVAVCANAPGTGQTAYRRVMGEGWTPLIRTRRLGARIGAEDLWVKDEGLNPTGSFKARGLACAISMCSELGIKKDRDSVGRKCGRRDGRVCRRSRNGSAHLHAEGCAARELHRMQSVRRARDAGRWPDQRLRAHCRRAKAGGRLVRRHPR